MEKPQYFVSFNRDRGIPNWVARYLDNTWLGNPPRKNDFRSDSSLPPNCITYLSRVITKVAMIEDIIAPLQIVRIRLRITQQHSSDQLSRQVFGQEILAVHFVKLPYLLIHHLI